MNLPAFLSDIDLGSPDRAVITRGRFSVYFDPLEFWYAHRPVPLSPLEGAIFALLMLRGRSTWEAIEAVIGKEGSSATREVLIYRIRRKFRAAGAQDPIETVRGWGVRLRTQPGAKPSAGLMIGARTAA